MTHIDHFPFLFFSVIFFQSLSALFPFNPSAIPSLSASFLPSVSLSSSLCSSSLSFSSPAYTMALEASSFSNLGLPDARNSLSNLLRTPTTPQSHTFSQNTSLLSDRTHILPDSSPIVHNLIICATELYGRFFSL